MTEGAPRDRAGYLATLVVTRWVLVRRPSVSESRTPELRLAPLVVRLPLRPGLADDALEE